MVLGGTANNHDLEIYGTSSNSAHFSWTVVTDDDVASQAASDAETYMVPHSSSHSPTFSSATNPRISFFLNYYEKIICPSVVVIDSPSNPYREHILSLASTSPASPTPSALFHPATCA
jgi:hypothetical protein